MITKAIQGFRNSTDWRSLQWFSPCTSVWSFPAAVLPNRGRAAASSSGLGSLSLRETQELPHGLKIVPLDWAGSADVTVLSLCVPFLLINLPRNKSWSCGYSHLSELVSQGICRFRWTPPYQLHLEEIIRTSSCKTYLIPASHSVMLFQGFTVYPSDLNNKQNNSLF